MSSQSRTANPTIVAAAAAAAAAMVTMAGTVWLMSPANYDDDSTSSSEEFDIYGRRKIKSSLLKGTRYSRRRRRRRQKPRKVHWSDNNESVSLSPASPASPASLSYTYSPTLPLSPSDSSDSGVPSPSAQNTASSSISDSPLSVSTPINIAENRDDKKSENKSSTSPLSSISSWRSPTSPLAKISVLQESAANAIINSANGIARKHQNKLGPKQITAGAPPTTINSITNNQNQPSAVPPDPLTNGLPPPYHDTTPYARFIQYLKPLRKDAWSEPDAASFLVRGPNYIKDGKKMNSSKAAFPLLTVDLIQHNGQEPYYHPICGHPRERVQQAIKREEEFGSATKELPPFVFAVNLCLPSSSGYTANQYYHQVSYFAIENMDEIQNETTPFGKLMKKFIFGDDDSFRDRTFKLIPKIVKGNFIVRRAVGSKPAIIGKKVKQYYFRGDRYFEILIDIGSDSIADRIVRLALGYANSLVTDMCFVLEGTDGETLPEQIFGGVSLKYIDFKAKDGDRRMLPLDYNL